LPYGEQLMQKSDRVARAVARYESLGRATAEPIVPARPITGYRTRAKLIVGPGSPGRRGQPAGLGLFAKGGGHRVVDIPGCKVLAPSLARVAEVLRDRIRVAQTEGSALAPFEPEGSGCLRALDLREVAVADDDPHVLVTFVVDRARMTDIAPLERAAAELMRACPEVVGVAANFHEGDAPQILGGQTTPLVGVTSSADRIGPSVHFATFGSFVQAHRGQAAQIHALLAEAILTHDATSGDRPVRVLDLYGGSGAIALGLAAAGAKVALVESFAPAVSQARAAARAGELAVVAECAAAARALQRMCEEGERFDAAVVNPPRRGVDPTSREWLARLGPEVIAYVSCDPETLARDLDHFARLGFAVRSLHPFDMIPLTEEVETVALLRRGEPTTPPVLYANNEVLIVDKSPHEPTTPQGEYAGSLLDRARRIPGAEDAVPVHRLDIGTSGLVLLARHRSHVAKWQAVLSSADAHKIYLAAVRGIVPTKGAIARALREEGKLVPARTKYRRLAVVAGHSLLRVTPEQGRTHQIRRHLSFIGHGVLGDDRYGHAPTNRYFEEKAGLDRAFLHCHRLELVHPDTKEPLVVEAPLPGDLRAVIERMGSCWPQARTPARPRGRP
jgi:23S rRNA (uracil1939-C5)-methyltransferase